MSRNIKHNLSGYYPWKAGAKIIGAERFYIQTLFLNVIRKKEIEFNIKIYIRKYSIFLKHTFIEQGYFLMYVYKKYVRSELMD